ncbi:nonsense-mediated mRNA decay factor SMG5 isoform X2 [Periplaneta americana]|uniref:nonsense-mediated mRNA decay factor SMG5 isoform X2 n=1 Tax=Periplaneta americana TaxID=6978 RepID=UPI0037E99005
MKKSYNPISDVRNESVELTRRLYRAISDVSRHLDDRRGRAQTCNDLFSPTVETQRVRLREYCERLIFSDPIGYGRKGEELLWRKGYYDVVTTAKRLRKNNTWSPLEIAYMQSHLAAGVGHYHHLLFRLQIEFKLDLRGIVDFPFLVNDQGLIKDKVSSSTKVLDNNCVEWAKQAVHRCLVYLGDLSRYFLDLHPHWDTGLAVRYYLQASNLNVDIGMPHNQLGTLSGTRNYGLDAAYHYMRCLMCKQPFDGAEGNLQRLLEKNSQWFEVHCNNQNRVEDSLSLHPAEHIHQLISRFLFLADIWFFNKRSLVETHKVCHQLLISLQQCLAYNKPFPGDGCEMKGEQIDLEQLSLFQTSEEDQENPEYLKDDLIFKMVVMSLLCVTKLQTSGSSQLTAVVAFTLAMFSQLVQQVIHHVQDSVFNMSFTSFASPPTTTYSLELNSTQSAGESNSNVPLPTHTLNNGEPSGQSCATQDTVAIVNGCSSAGKNNSQEAKAVTKKKKSKHLQRLRGRRRRRRRRQNSSEDSDLSDGDFSYGGGSSSSEDGNSDISESAEPDLDLSSDEEDEDDDDDEDEDEDEDDEDEEEEAKTSHTNSDGSKIDNLPLTNGKICNHIEVKEQKECSDLKFGKKDNLPESILANPSINLNGLGEEESSCNDSLVVSSNSSNNLKALTNKGIYNESKDVDKSSVKNSQVLDPADILELVAEEGLLDAVKVCADWLHGDSDIIKACGRSSRTLLTRFITLLNLVIMEADAFEKGSDVGQYIKLKNIQEMFSKIPLPEDVMLKGLPVLKCIHDKMDWDYLRHHCLNAKEEALLRVYKLVDFGHFLTTIPDTGVCYDTQQRLFSIISDEGIASEMSDEKTEENSVTNVPDDNDAGINHHSASASNPSSTSRRGQLMHHMGQLWLRAEVRDLESRVRRRGASFSPYLAVDSDALIHYIHLVKQLVGARKFIILIPSVVVSALDELKREIGRARETIRWLESQFQRGNRFLRAQRSHERLPLPLIKYPKKKDKEAWLYFQVVECCHYFSQQTGVHETLPETPLVTLLTGQKSCASSKDEGNKGFSPLGVAKSAGINLEHIELFHAKWKTSSKSHG